MPLMPGRAAGGEARVPRLSDTRARNLKLTISYDGTRFVGWQRQAAGVSVQGLLEDALARFEGAPVAVHGAGRTDAGVHALGQVASARMTSAPSRYPFCGTGFCSTSAPRLTTCRPTSWSRMS